MNETPVYNFIQPQVSFFTKVKVRWDIYIKRSNTKWMVVLLTVAILEYLISQYIGYRSIISILIRASAFIFALLPVFIFFFDQLPFINVSVLLFKEYIKIENLYEWYYDDIDVVKKLHFKNENLDYIKILHVDKNKAGFFVPESLDAAAIIEFINSRKNYLKNLKDEYYFS